MLDKQNQKAAQYPLEDLWVVEKVDRLTPSRADKAEENLRLRRVRAEIVRENARRRAPLEKASA
ncbi:MAG: hypothetical protein ACYC9Q_05300 [Bacillota bacterium]